MLIFKKIDIRDFILISIFFYKRSVFTKNMAEDFLKSVFKFFLNNKNTSNRSFTLIKVTIYLRLRSDIFLTRRGYSYLVTATKII